ncbi:hypothetical protein HWV62_12777 [Athelia sp. TMB]|nr:hypothetical protein HWV62_12777 [Athelia sp. TMB]
MHCFGAQLRGRSHYSQNLEMFVPLQSTSIPPSKLIEESLDESLPFHIPGCFPVAGTNIVFVGLIFWLASENTPFRVLLKSSSLAV